MWCKYSFTGNCFTYTVDRRRNWISDCVRAQTTEYYTEGSLDEKSVTRFGSCQGGECLDALAKNFIPASTWRYSPPDNLKGL